MNLKEGKNSRLWKGIAPSNSRASSAKAINRSQRNFGIIGRKTNGVPVQTLEISKTIEDYRRKIEEIKQNEYY